MCRLPRTWMAESFRRHTLQLQHCDGHAELNYKKACTARWGLELQAAARAGLPAAVQLRAADSQRDMQFPRGASPAR